MKVFIENVMFIRKHSGISKKGMAKLLGIGVGSLNKIEKGEIPPNLSVEVIFNIHRHFGIHPKDLFGQQLGVKPPFENRR